MLLDLVVETAVDRMPRGLVGMRAEKDTRVMVCHSWKSRIVTPYRSGAARLRPWLRELSFWQHDTSTPVNKHGVKLHKALLLGTIGRSLADEFSEDQICSSQGFDLIIGATRHHFRSYLEAEPEVQEEVALYQTMRASKGLLWNTRHESATNFVRWKVASKSFFRQN